MTNFSKKYDARILLERDKVPRKRVINFLQNKFVRGLANAFILLENSSRHRAILCPKNGDRIEEGESYDS
jgi:hypothetical protein